MRPPKHDLIEPELSLKPLVDVCLVLAILLLVVAPMLRTSVEAASPASLKAAGKARPAASAPVRSIGATTSRMIASTRQTSTSGFRLISG